ncbi:MAG: hypothetical protein ACOC7N_05740 [Chloroflexota bacterium]
MKRVVINGITVVATRPGWVRTGMGEALLLSRPSRLAESLKMPTV